MRSISAVGVRSVRRSFSRYLLTALGASLGVAVMFGVLATNASIDAGLNRALGRARTPTVAIDPIGSYGNTLPSSTIEKVAGLPDVGRVSGGVFVVGTLAGTDRELDLYGGRSADGPAATRSTARWDADADFEGRVPAPGADEVSLSRTRAAELGVGLGDTVDVETRTGPVKLTVVRVIDWPDQNGIVSLATAQRLFGRGDVVQMVSVQLADDTSASTWVATHREALGPDVRMTAAAGGDELRGAITVIQNGFSALALLATFVGGFLIYLTLSTSVAERARTWGVLRAVGADRIHVVRAVLAESLVLGALATVGGIALGALLGGALLQFTARLYELPEVSLTLTRGSIIAAVVVGLLMPPCAALLPAWRAAKAEPVDAMRDRHVDPAQLGRAWIAGAVLLGLATLMQFRGAGSGGRQMAPVIFMLGAVLVVPLVLGPVAKVVGRATARLVPGLGEAAVNHLVKERRRSAYTLGLVMVVLAMVLALGGMQESILKAMREGFAVRFGADVSVWAWDGMAPDVANALRTAEGVEQSTEFRSGRVGIAAPVPQQAELMVVEPTSFFAMQGFPWSEGDDESAEAALLAGGAVLVPQSYAERTGVGAGDEVSLGTTAGVRPFRVAGVYTTPERGVRVVVGLTDGEQLFAATTPQGLELRAAEGVAPEALQQRVKEIVGGRPGYYVNTTAGEEAQAAQQIQNYFRPFLAVILMAGIVGALGLANTLGIAVLRRTREIGVLRAVGIDRRALGGMVLVEALTMGAVAFVLSLPLGWICSSALLSSSSAELGFLVELAAPWGMLPILAVAVLLICGLAAVGPARRIARLDPVAALRFE